MAPAEERSDEVLCALVSQGDRAAEEELASRYGRLVRSCSRPYFLVGGDSEDLIQEGMIGLLSAIRTFQPGHDAVFSTYAEVCVRNRIRSAVRAAARDKHAPLNQSLPLLDSVIDEDSGAYPYGTSSSRPESPEELLIGREEQESRMRTLLSHLSRFEKTILESYLYGLSYSEIAERAGKSLKSVDNAVQRIRRKVAHVLTSGDISVS